jgi:hypothetical protein
MKSKKSTNHQSAPYADYFEPPRRLFITRVNIFIN